MIDAGVEAVGALVGAHDPSAEIRAELGERNQPLALAGLADVFLAPGHQAELQLAEAGVPDVRGVETAVLVIRSANGIADQVIAVAAEIARIRGDPVGEQAHDVDEGLLATTAAGVVTIHRRVVDVTREFEEQPR